MKTANLHALMSAPITCTLPLTDVLKVRPELWESVAKRLQDVGLWNKELTLDKVLKTKTVVSRHSIKALVQVNKVGKKIEDDEGNTTLPVTINNVKSIVILDSGARNRDCYKIHMGIMGQACNSENQNEFATSRWELRASIRITRRCES